jgi:endonuclease/exonuclease/phosphatase family metal-dependent hydrolase
VGAVTIMGLQEVLDNQLVDIKDGLGSNWAHIGFGRDDGAKSGEYSPILYRTDVVNLVYSEMKWLSLTPDVVSYGWGAGSRRVVTIGVFKDITTGKLFMHANTHLDNVSSQARSEGIKIVVARIKAVQALYGPLGVTLTGDFNSDPSGDAYVTLQGLGYLTEIWNSGATRVGTNQLTYTGFTTTGVSRIDFVWLGPEADKLYSAQQFEILGNYVDDMIISDHRAIAADITLL